MIKFDAKDDCQTIAECLEPAMKIKTKKEAEQYLNDYALYLEGFMSEVSKDASPDEHFINIAKSNIGYYAGYFSNQVRERMEQLFNCEHPVFGKISELGPPTFEEALNCGIRGITLKELREEANVQSN